MTDSDLALRAVRRLDQAIREAVVESKTAYEFVANSYTFSAMNACLAAGNALEALRDLLADHFEASNHDQP